MRIKLYFLLLFTFLHSNDLGVNLENLPLEKFVQVSSKILNINILYKNKLDGFITFSSKDKIPNDTLFALLEKSLALNGYKLKKQKNIYYIEKIFLKDNQTKKNKTLEKKKKIKNKIKVISLKNIDVEKLSKLLKKFKKEKNELNLFISEDVFSNSLILVGDEKQIFLIENLIKEIDKNETQIFIEAKIVELNNSLINEVGIKYGLWKRSVNNSQIYTISSNFNNFSGSLNLNNLNISANTLKSSLLLNATLSLLEENYALNILSEPSLLCLNNHSGSIYVGESVSIQTSTTTTSGGNKTDSFERKDIGLKLEVLPRVSNDNKIRVKINTSIENLKETSTNKQPNSSKKSINTSAIVENGESIVLGGLIQSKKENLNESVPYISKIPFLGKLFEYNKKTKSKQSLMIIITPYIVPKDKTLTFLREKLTKLKKLEKKVIFSKLNEKKQNKNSSVQDRFNDYFTNH